MTMWYTAIAGAVVLLAMTGTTVLAQGTSVCGEPPPVTDDALKGEIQGKAQLLSKYVGEAQLSGKIETSRREIFKNFPDSAKTRSDAYFEYEVCVFLMLDTTKAYNEKLDQLLRIHREFARPIQPRYQSGPPGTKPPTNQTKETSLDGKPSKPPQSAWDTSFLPNEYQAVYVQAIETWRLAGAAQRTARENAKFAEDAELRATSSTPGHAEIPDDYGTYRGQVDATGRIVGMGVRHVTSGDLQGDVILGQWKIESQDAKTGVWTSKIVGPGVWHRESNIGNRSNHKLYEGDMNGAVYNGRGVLTLDNGDVVYSTWHDNAANGSVYVIKSDGYLFSGNLVDGKWSGPGILWAANGQIFRVGIWNASDLVDDKTASLLPR